MIAILKYNAGNVTSVENAVQNLGYSTVVTDDIEMLKSADKVIFPGVGEASSAMKYLKEKGLDKVIRELTQPVLGICLGMQLMCESSEEGDTKGLGIFDAKVLQFPPTALVPQMGWNNFTSLKGKLFDGIALENDCYFVHSFYAKICPETIAVSDYILPFSAALQKNNFYATQFHPEKSAKIGLQILNNFLKS
ncbi:imidazole glycerol phosphate synthase subunit HisH [Flavobacterium antarcticum]|uniref:imidazole glycerol phosphate synthase subunit HisH n=1 Tax=Flavobacterium antarcticum TaxID=271155 RepID=UPI0003B4F6B8|nr:imidazole glycerol phosphate synthase subunit HisH [Flavobacterium antarcticum]